MRKTKKRTKITSFREIITFALLAALCLLAGCAGKTEPDAPVIDPAPPTVDPTPVTPAEPSEAEQAEARLRERIAGMSIEEKVGQMFFVRCPEMGAAEDVAAGEGGVARRAQALRAQQGFEAGGPFLWGAAAAKIAQYGVDPRRGVGGKGMQIEQHCVAVGAHAVGKHLLQRGVVGTVDAGKAQFDIFRGEPAAVERRAVGSVQREQAVRPRPARLRLRGAVHIGSRAHIRVDDGCDGEIVREQLRQMRIAPRQALLRVRTQRTGEKFRHARPAVRQRQHRRRGGVGAEQQGRIGGAIGHGGGSFRGEFCRHTV